MERPNDRSNYKLILFISGMSVKSIRAIDNIRRIGGEYLGDRLELEIIDLSLNKRLAVDYQVFAIPTLLKTSPEPRRTLVGDLSDTKKVLKILDLGD
jgi:circadian clock protein KaiB